MADTRLNLAETFLQEAVYQSRAKQAAGAGLLKGKLEHLPKGPTNCGLGKQAAIELGFSDKAAELFAELWPEPAPDELTRIQAGIRGWVARQDQLDRDRNHFMKAFRHEHGFDRTQYTPELMAKYEHGLAEVNARCNRERETAARALLG